MKFNIEIEMTPEEFRVAMGLPDVQGIQKQMMDQFTERLQSSAEQQEAFMRMVMGAAAEPWQAFARMAGMVPPGNRPE